MYFPVHEVVGKINFSPGIKNLSFDIKTYIPDIDEKSLNSKVMLTIL